MRAYRYPSQRHRRKHGPQGYASPAQFGEWLRDEFVFRCVYCLEREQWVNRTGHFHGDHFLPVALAPPGGNTRPAGVEESHYALRRQGKLPDTY